MSLLNTKKTIKLLIMFCYVHSITIYSLCVCELMERKVAIVVTFHTNNTLKKMNDFFPPNICGGH